MTESGVHSGVSYSQRTGVLADILMCTLTWRIDSNVSTVHIQNRDVQIWTISVVAVLRQKHVGWILCVGLVGAVCEGCKMGFCSPAGTSTWSCSWRWRSKCGHANIPKSCEFSQVNRKVCTLCTGVRLSQLETGGYDPGRESTTLIRTDLRLLSTLRPNSGGIRNRRIPRENVGRFDRKVYRDFPTPNTTPIQAGKPRTVTGYIKGTLLNMLSRF